MKLSISMMVKNEEKNLERCLKSLQPLLQAVQSELIIVDTGSEDRTVEIAKQFTDKVYFHAWNNDFSAMRNITISYAKGEWILIFDADEELENYQPLVTFMNAPSSKKYNAVAITGKSIVSEDKKSGFSVMMGFRLFRNDGYFHYEGAVHNQAKFQGDHIAIPEVSLLHYGYLSTDKELMERKFLRTSAILEQELEKDPTNVYYWAQLSVTYGMYNDFEKSIEYIEKAYALLPEKRTPNYMFVFIHMALAYQHVKNYEKVEAVCLEAVAIKKGYLDIYYYLAEAQAILKKYPEATANYEAYLKILKQHNNEEQKDVSIIEYTLGLYDLVYYNLSLLCRDQNQYEKALYYAKQISDNKYIKEALPSTVFLYIKLADFNGLRKYYDTYVLPEWWEDFFQKVENIKQEIIQEGNKDINRAIALDFYDLNHNYGLLSRLIVEEDKDSISQQTKDMLANLELEHLPVYCSDIFYYLLKWQYPLEQVVVSFKEKWLNYAFEYINKYHGDLYIVIYNYLQNYICNNNLHEYKLGKTLSRFVLLLDKLNADQYKEVFSRYIQDGLYYLRMLYNSNILENTLVYEVKNDEEVFLLFMYQAQMYQETSQAEYLKYLRQALQAFPGMKLGIEMLLQEVQEGEQGKQQEFELYKGQVKETIKELINSGKLSEASAILNEYKVLVPDDIESVLLESKIFLN